MLLDPDEEDHEHDQRDEGDQGRAELADEVNGDAAGVVRRIGCVVSHFLTLSPGNRELRR